MKIPIRKTLNYSIFCLISSIIFFITYTKLDSDFGWHLKAGEMIVKHGVSTKEYFTYSMPDYPFVDFEWGSHLLFFYGYEWLGFFGLSALYSSFVLLSLLICSKKLKNGPIKLSLLLMSAGSLLFFLGVRAQIISWVFFALVIYILEYLEKTKWKFSLPVLFLLWANVHGAFVLGLVVFGLFTVFRTIQTRKVDISQWILFFLSIGATLINPYGINLWHETWLIISDSQLRWTIVEWQPVFLFPKFSLWAIAGVVTILVLSLKKKVPLPLLAVEAFLFVSAISSVRNVPYFVFFSLFFISALMPLAEKPLLKGKEVRRRYLKAQHIFLLIAGTIFLVEGGVEVYKARYYTEEKYYPLHAVGFLKENPTSGNVFSEYVWGGYLIWKYPEKKVYIDGRMSSWKVMRNGKEYKAFDEYRDLINGKISLVPFLSRYSVDTVLLPNDRGGKDSYLNKWHATLLKKKWKIVYKDSSAVVYRKSF